MSFHDEHTTLARRSWGFPVRRISAVNLLLRSWEYIIYLDV